MNTQQEPSSTPTTITVSVGPSIKRLSLQRGTNHIELTSEDIPDILNMIKCHFNTEYLNFQFKDVLLSQTEPAVGAGTESFEPHAWYNPYGKSIEFYAEDTDFYADYVPGNRLFEVFRQNDTNLAVGFLLRWNVLKRHLNEGCSLYVLPK